ncbi:uncharacterized protein LOC143353252 isoform X3 [Halictus rubicundus]|uniref:uncharacterized protein LOC143353252 isoform X3 n=1 Tax=Halictus rubicundus TaxID=77578 RepID=UPI004036DBEA
MMYDGSHRDFLQTRSHRCGNYHCYGKNKVGGSASDGLLVRSWADGLRRRYGGEGDVRGEYVTTNLTELTIYRCILDLITFCTRWAQTNKSGN